MGWESLGLNGTIEIERGHGEDYEPLAHFHYVEGKPAAWMEVWVARFRPAVPSRLRRERIIGAACVAGPPLNHRARERAISLPARGSARHAFLNRHVRTISRIVVHAQFRSLGIATALIKRICNECTARWVESSAMMGHVHPLFEKAGMRRIQGDARKPAYFILDREQDCGAPAPIMGEAKGEVTDGASNKPGDDSPREEATIATHVKAKRKPPVFQPCADEDQLDEWVRRHLGLTIPRKASCDGHAAPFDYLKRAYFEPSSDQVIWAPRGGGKTRLGAVASLLDLLHKPGIQVRILGGSMEQSLKMWEYLLPDLERLGQHELARQLRGRNILLPNQSRAAVIAQSQRSVRGMRIHKLRCDEVELFDPQVWEASQLTVRSEKLRLDGKTDSAATEVRGAIEAMSTHHQPWGLMSRVLARAESLQTPIVKWSIIDVLEKCPPERDCQTCLLHDDCRGVAKNNDGFYRIDDAIAMKQRVSTECWESEMMCLRPRRSGRVFPTFSREVHVMAHDAAGGEVALGIDFGFAAPFVCLWTMSMPDGRVQVIDEYVKAGQTVAEHLKEIASREARWGPAGWIGCDPAGSARNEQTGESNVRLLRKSGTPVRTRRSVISDGIECIRADLQPAAGPVRLRISSRCVNLIKAMEMYHYPRDGQGETPEKDGEHDHLIDALCYFYVNRARGAALGGRRY